MTYLLTFFSSHTILDILFKGLKSFKDFFKFHDRENEIGNEVVILLVVALIFSPTVYRAMMIILFTLSDLLTSVLPGLETRCCFLETPGLEIVNPKSILLYRVLMLICLPYQIYYFLC